METCRVFLREWELSFRLGMRPWIAVAYSAPVAAATAVFLIYPIGQGSFSDGKLLAPTSSLSCSQVSLGLDGAVYMLIFFAVNWSNPSVVSYLKGGSPTPTRVKDSKKKLFSIHSFQPEGPDPGPSGDEDNSLLNSQNRVKGTVYPLETITTTDILNTPSVYAIRCKTTNKHYVGETINLRERVATHKTKLLNNFRCTGFLNSNLSFMKVVPLGKTSTHVIIVRKRFKLFFFI
jgi:hypothetical protein